MTKTRRDAIAITIAMVIILALSIAAFSMFRGKSNYESAMLIPPGPFHGVHGSNFGADGLLYVGDIAGSSIHAVNVTTGKHHVVVGPPEGMADDVAIAPVGSPHAGTLVWSGIVAGKLYARAPGGAVRVLAANLPQINSVVFAPDGRLFAAQMGPGNNVLWEFDLTDPAKGGKPPQRIWDETGGLNSFVVRDNFLFGPQGDKGAIVRFDLTTHDLRVLADGLKWPVAAKMDAKGRLFALDLEAGTVHRVDADLAAGTKGTAPVIATLEPGLDNFSIGANGKLYVSSITRNGLFEIDPDSGAERAIVRGQLTAPGGAAFAGTGDDARLYIADLFSLRAVVPKTGAVTTVIPMSEATIYPAAVSAHAGPGGDHLIVTGWFTNRLQVLERPTGVLLREEKDLAAPHDAIELDDGTLIVAETGAHRLTRIAPDGARGVLPTNFAEPVGLAQKDGALFVTDAWAGTLSKVELKTGHGSVIASGFGRPEGVAVRADGQVLVVDSLRKTLVAVDPASGQQVVMATMLAVGLEAPPPLGPTFVHNGVAIAPDGVIYLPSDTRAALYTMTPSR